MPLLKVDQSAAAEADAQESREERQTRRHICEILSRFQSVPLPTHTAANPFMTARRSKQLDSSKLKHGMEALIRLKL